MIRNRLYHRTSAKSYLRKKNNQRNNVINTQQRSESSAESSDNDYELGDMNEMMDISTDVSVMSEVGSDHGHNIDLDWSYSPVIVKIAKIFDEINVSDATQLKLYNLFRYIGIEKLYLPEYKDYLKQVSSLTKIGVKRYFYCSNCGVYGHSMNTCPCQDQPDDLHVFNLKETIQLAVKYNHEYLSSSANCTKVNEGDFIGSLHYQKIWIDKEGIDLLRFTLIFNIDDASFVKSNRVSATPISFIIAELPLHRRYCKQNVFLAGLWWGHTKANYQKIWELCVAKQLETLEIDGFEVELHGEIKNCAVKIGAIVADSVAKPKLMNIVQFNGSYGCPYCLHPGESVRTSRGGTTMTYPWNGHEFDTKTQVFYNDAAEQTMRLQSSYMGVKGPCILSNLNGFPFNFPVDYMHSVLEGVFKTLMNQKPFNQQTTMTRIDTVGKKIVLPHEFSRKFRKIADLTYWKAHECRTFLLYLTPLIRDLVDADSFCLIMALSASLRILVKPKLCNAELDMSKDLIKIFLTSYEMIYGSESMRFNIHLLIHLVSQAKMMGSLSNVSSFVFENNIFTIKQRFHGNRGQNSQMAERYRITKSLNAIGETLRWPCSNQRSNVQEYRQQYHLIGKPDALGLRDDSIIKLLRARHGLFNPNHCKIFSRVKKAHIHYHSLGYKYRRKSASFYFFYSDNQSQERRYGEIQYFVLCPQRITQCGHDMIYVVYKEFQAYSKQSIFTKLENLKHSVLKTVPNLVKNAQVFHKIKATQKLNIMDLAKVEGKAILTLDSNIVNIYYATAIDAAFEHD